MELQIVPQIRLDFAICGQSYKCSTIVNYNSRAYITSLEL